MWVVVVLLFGLVSLSQSFQNERKTSFTSGVDLIEGDQDLVLKPSGGIISQGFESNATESEETADHPEVNESKDNFTDHITVNLGSEWGFLFENINDTLPELGMQYYKS